MIKVELLISKELSIRETLPSKFKTKKNKLSFEDGLKKKLKLKVCGVGKRRKIQAHFLCKEQLDL